MNKLSPRPRRVSPLIQFMQIAHILRRAQQAQRSVFDTLYGDLPQVYPRPLTPPLDLDTPPYLRIREQEL